MKILLFSAMLLVSSSAFAQLMVGVSGGISRNYLSVNNRYQSFLKYSGKTGIQVGIPVEYSFSKSFSIHSDLSFVQKGHEWKRTGEYKGIYAKHDNRYAQLPILARISCGGDRLRFFYELGGFMGYWIQGKVKGAQTDIFTSQKDKDKSGDESSISDILGLIDYKDKYEYDNRRDRRLEAGVSSGAGISYENAKGKIFLGIRYDRSLTDMQKKSNEYRQPTKFNDLFLVQIGTMVKVSKLNIK